MKNHPLSTAARSAALLLSGLLLALGAAAPIHAKEQTPVQDRSISPQPGPRPTLRVPERSRMKLANGTELQVAERRGLPLVTLELSFIGGTNQYQPAGKEGLAALTAAMLSEGTASRTGDQLSDELQLLGTRITASVGDESGRIGFTTTRDKLEPVARIMADMLLHPAFPAEALDRLRARTLVGLQQARDRTSGIAARVFPRVVYGDAHPYGRQTTDQSVRGITREDLLQFHREYFRPGRAVITVVGDVEHDAVRSMLDRTLAEWPAGGSRPTFAYPSLPQRAGTAIYLVDRPGAEQSTVIVGTPGPPRDTPDYYALQVLNTILGGMFQSRLNANLREQKGYSYGVSSRFGFGRGPGAFRAGGELVTAKTDAGLIEIMREIRGVRGEIPFTDAEIAVAKARLAQSLPEVFASTSGTASALAGLVVQGLPDDYYQNYERNINAVSKEDLLRVARQYLDPEHLALVVVGDRSRIETGLQATHLAPVVHLDVEGVPLPVGKP